RLRQLACKIRMRPEDAEPLRFAGGTEDAGERVVQSAGRVMRRAEFKVEGSLGYPRGMFEDAAEAGDEIGFLHTARAQRGSAVGVMRAPMRGDLPARRQP